MRTLSLLLSLAFISSISSNGRAQINSGHNLNIYSGSLNRENLKTIWVESVRPHSTAISESGTVSRFGNIAFLAATRSSDSQCSGCMGSIGLESIALNDNAKMKQTAYSAYFEAVRGIGATGTTHALEMDIVNRGALVEAGPANMFSDGITPALWVASGGGHAVSSASMAIGIIANGSKFDKGIVFGNNAINERADSKEEAISLPSKAAISFYDPSGRVIGNIYGQGQYSGATVNIRFDGGNLVIEKSDGTPLLTVTQAGLRIGSVSGVSCSGHPTAEFTVSNGLITHC